ncbi:hypothetical protein Anapl_12463 [Anas platyrhynchos]|uniref:Uncharacterized protein n=1 Tax=Anas platyrhynchos TaxID=8839 RepID=R0JEH5_ANAPL|nr:hypothetical protein Anapl_12463 [Anas platyrhynchos]
MRTQNRFALKHLELKELKRSMSSQSPCKAIVHINGNLEYSCNYIRRSYGWLQGYIQLCWFRGTTVLTQVSAKKKKDKIIYELVKESCLPGNRKRKYCKEMALKALEEITVEHNGVRSRKLGPCPDVQNENVILKCSFSMSDDSQKMKSGLEENQKMLCYKQWPSTGKKATRLLKGETFSRSRANRELRVEAPLTVHTSRELHK